MTELSILWETATGTGDSDTSGYDDDTMFQLFRSLFSRTANMGGVSPDYLNELAVTGTSSPVAVNTGAALVYGIPYFNSASVNVAVATPAASTRIDRIVLRADWTAQTVRITRIAGVEGGSAPAMTQTPGTTWDIPLATVSITTGGVITVTDAREWLGGTGDGTVDSTKLADDVVTFAKMQNIATDSLIGRDTASSGDPENITLNATLSMTGSGALQRAALTGDVTASAGSNATTIANDAVTNAKAADMTQSTIKGRASGAGTGDPTDLTATQARAVLNVEDGADVTDAGNVGSSIHGASAKTTPVAADTFPLIDSAASNVLKKVTLTNLATAVGSALSLDLNTLLIPLTSGPITASSLTTNWSGGSYFDSDDLPATATVKIFVQLRDIPHTDADVYIRYANIDGTGSTNMTAQQIAVETADNIGVLGSDIASSLPSGLKYYKLILEPKAGAGTSIVETAFLLVEW